ncbi:MAG: hypothetical protein LBJ99_00095, partial [Oscillospiraceae bacterium]|nr:hypothetical protein [Oscillospiraceae bacterium]
MAMAANTELFTEIDALELGANNRAWREAMKAAPYKIFAEREKYTVASWRETEGEDLQLRRAKLLARVLDNIEIKIHPFDEIAGRPTPGVIGCATSFDVCGDYIPAIWSDSDEIDATLDARVSLAPEDKDILREAARAFGKTAAPAMTYRAWENIAGSWARDAEAAKLKDPTLDSAIYGQTTSALLWEKTLSVGLRAFVSEAKEKLDGYVGSEGADARKIYFWQSAIVSLEAVIRHAHRYANLAEAQGREEMAETLRRVPEFPARNLREALQSMVICNVGKMLEHPMQNNSHWARADQYLYEYFMNDL